MDEELKKLLAKQGINIMYGYDGKPQYYKNGKMLTGQKHSNTMLLHSKTKSELKNKQTREGIDSALSNPFVNAALPLTSLYTAGKKIINRDSPEDIAVELAASVPFLKPLGQAAKLSSQMVKANLGLGIVRGVDLADDLATDEEKNKKIKKEIKAPVAKKVIKTYANGGTIRPDSRKRHIIPAIIGAAVAIGSTIVSASAAKKAQDKQKQQLGRQEMLEMQQQMLMQQEQDKQKFQDHNINGNDNVEYYKKGGQIDDEMSPEQLAMIQQSMTQGGGTIPNLPVSKGGYQTQGGNLVPIAPGVEKVVGNKHNDTKVDGVSGVQLYKNGELEAEVEGGEIIADGNVVYSDQLKYKNKTSYAKMMEKVTKERVKLEKDQTKTNNKRKANTIERKLAGLTMAEQALFAHQEQSKIEGGHKVLENKFAVGGAISSMASNAKLKRKNGIPLTQQEEDMLAKDAEMNSNNETKNTSGSETAAAQSSSPTATTSRIDPGADTADAANQSKTTKTVNDIAKFAPMFVDNIANYMLSQNTPKLATPLLNRAEPLESTVNVNPQLAEIRSRTKSMKDNILNNTSNSNNAKNNLLAVNLTAGKQTDELLGNKANQEMQLRNAGAQNRQMVNAQNNATMNQHSMNQYQRQNDIRTQLSANVADLSKDFQNIRSYKQAEKNFKGYTKANLMDDKLGEKAVLYMDDNEFMNDPELRGMIISKVNAVDSSGNYLYPAARQKAQKLGFL